MAFTIALVIIFVALIWLLIEYIQAATLNEFLDKKIMLRFLWLWLPFYALWRLSRELFFKGRRR
jgi:hypothetical protein